MVSGVDACACSEGGDVLWATPVCVLDVDEAEAVVAA